ncbi:glycine cleavage system protein GcvH [Clostridiaceae bacterium 35-E11]
MKVLKELLYTENHEWVKVEGEKAYIGITDFAQHAMGDIVFVEMPNVGDEFEIGDALGVVESVKAASDIYMPVGGTVEVLNEALEDDPALINEDAYKNWIIQVTLTDKAQLEALLSPEDYEKLCEEEA